MYRKAELTIAGRAYNPAPISLGVAMSSLGFREAGGIRSNLVDAVKFERATGK
jgi:hypothetical protein